MRSPAPGTMLTRTDGDDRVLASRPHRDGIVIRGGEARVVSDRPDRRPVTAIESAPFRVLTEPRGASNATAWQQASRSWVT